jgi:hypothetical protein
MKGATLADAALMNNEATYEQLEQLRVQNQNLQIENQLLKALIGN